MKLSKHFSLDELTKSDVATRFGINNEPDYEVISRLILLAENILEPVRAEFGVPIKPTSGFRCLELNRAIKSSDTSQHIRGEAVDFEVAGVSNVALAHWIKDNLDFDQLILEFYEPSRGANSGWVHVSYKRHGNRGQVLTINSNGVAAGLPKLED